MENTHSEDGRLKRWGRLSPVWMIIGLVAVGAASTLAGAPAPVLPVVGAVLALAAYWLVMKYVARREVPEIARAGAARQAASGVAMGLGFLLGSVALIAILGGYSFTWGSGNLLWAVVSAASVSLAGAVTEELLFRGLALQALERMFGSGVAVAITAVFFGLVHLGNPGATLWSSLAIAVEAGVLLGAGFLWRRSIWFVAGFHFAWNTTQTLLGIPTSGHETGGILSAHAHGPAIWSGGDFGIEASIVPIIVGAAIAVLMLSRARREGRIVPMRRSRR
ncbi:MAG TPA: type II CAAX endopeptidase family protein [Stackebrandtia sp.]|uniref:CPBP family intramembrane glutamic endopeptidase n=1 Tax=Stackebrandtia sp. TaxID=2023065 RepID=UPI002D5AEE6C|nr:type II CAAX endopeptidase family protein [Stackebrandtia sp.]HZE40378.1 type II CAAX endopeptidase family protein [Stackebrandtia sp.]